MRTRRESRRLWIEADPSTGVDGYWEISHHVLELTQAEIDQRDLDAAEYEVTLAARAALQVSKERGLEKLRALGLTDVELGALALI